MSSLFRRKSKAHKKTRQKRRQTRYFDEGHLQLKQGIWHAVMPIPRDVQEIVGKSLVRKKTRFTASLKTTNIEEARMRLPAYIRQWEAQISQARRLSSTAAPANSWAAALRDEHG